jgi:hypothetical protein
MKCKGFVGWKREDEFQKALSAYKQHVDDAAVTIPYVDPSLHCFSPLKSTSSRRRPL